jgi:DNA-binding NarL/FixJ family response regulator
MCSSTIRVLVADDYEPFRQFLVLRLKQRPVLQIVGQVSDGQEAVRKAEELKPDLILLDIDLPTLNGIDAAREIRKLSPESKIIFVTQEFCNEMVQAAHNLGASGYVLKAEAGSKLLAAVDAVLEGRLFFSSGL